MRLPPYIGVIGSGPEGPAFARYRRRRSCAVSMSASRAASVGSGSAPSSRRRLRARGITSQMQKVFPGG